MKYLLYIWMMQNVLTKVNGKAFKKTAIQNETKSQICKIKRKPIATNDYVNFILCKGKFPKKWPKCYAGNYVPVYV